MGGAGRGARVVPTDESGTALLSHSAAVFTPVVPVDHAADDPESGAFGPALADACASLNVDGHWKGCAFRLLECALPWLWSARVAVGLCIGARTRVLAVMLAL